MKAKRERESWQSVVIWQQFDKAWVDRCAFKKWKKINLPPQLTSVWWVSRNIQWNWFAKERNRKDKKKTPTKNTKMTTEDSCFAIYSQTWLLILNAVWRRWGKDGGERVGNKEVRGGGGRNACRSRWALFLKTQIIFHLGLIEQRNLSIIPVMQLS